MAKKIKRNTSISISAELYDWLKNESINISEFVGNLLEYEYIHKADPLTKIKRLQDEYDTLYEQLEFYYGKLQKTIEDGNKKEREEAEELLNRKIGREKEELDKNLKILEELRKVPTWEAFVNNLDDFDIKGIGNWYEENIINKDKKLHKSIGGIFTLVRLTKKLTKEQLKGGLISK